MPNIHNFISKRICKPSTDMMLKKSKSTQEFPTWYRSILNSTQVFPLWLNIPQHETTYFPRKLEATLQKYDLKHRIDILEWERCNSIPNILEFNVFHAKQLNYDFCMNTGTYYETSQEYCFSFNHISFKMKIWHSQWLSARLRHLHC